MLGVEPGEFACKNSRLKEHEQICAYFMDAEINRQFDVVHIEQVLSHMPDAKDNLLKAKSLLKPGGVMVVEEPNDGNPLQDILEGYRGKYWVCKDHVNYWDFDGFEEFIDDCG